MHRARGCGDKLVEREIAQCVENKEGGQKDPGATLRNGGDTIGALGYCACGNWGE